MRITALQRQPRRGVNLHLDRAFALSLSLDICTQFHRRIGDELGAERVAEMGEAHARHAALEHALRLLAYRPRSEAELRDRLARKGIAGHLANATLDWVRELRLIDDDAFAHNLVEGRDRNSPRARRLMAAELRAKGIERGAAAHASAVIDDEDAAYRAATRRATSLTAAPYPDFRRRVTTFLLRRGFDHETARSAVDRAWAKAGHFKPHGDG